ncbi:restriction endonuclease subunit S [Prevotella copri]|uniref:restriction endonuclease subunit S n=1 Tax=Segatella copri TaxID=165179 RepID=UPI0022314E96|nr:restriction endonuclease subunit S [Segatella copri]MCW4096572.1 restriction endonuclease subunit S [Segatella copri]
MDTKALRQKILDLAIHGKLVPQDPNDEPASVLLERIRAEKERLIKEGKIKKGKKSAKTSDKPHYPFELPEGWVWCKLEDITSVIGDGLHGTPQYNPNGAYYFVNGNNLSNRQIIIKNNTKRVSEEEYIKYKKPLNEHTILVSINGTIGNIGTYSNEQIILGKSACYFNITPFLVKEYMCYVIESNYFQKYALLSATGSTIKNVPLKAINEFYVPIPPVSEQKRIVSEIDYLLAFINKVEEGRENLQSIVQSAKSKILDLAIHGKLVPQDPNEEPASELLKRINPKAEITCDTPQYGKLLKGWCETTLKSLAKEVFAGGDKPTEFTKEKTNGNIIPIYSNGVEKDGLYGYTNVARVIEPCLTVSARGTIGFTCIRNIPFVPIVRLITIVPNPAFDLKYMKFCLDCLLIWSEGSSIPQLTVPTIKKMQLPLPPLQEQHRIVAKIEELFNQLNKIEESVL